MVGAERWRNNWRVLSPPAAVPVELPRSPAGRTAARERISALPAGTPVVLFASAPGSVRRCRSFASKARVSLEREYLAFPSAQAPAYLIEDHAAPIRAFARTVLVAPPRVPLSAAVDIGMSLLSSLSPHRLMRLLAPGRVVVGRRA